MWPQKIQLSNDFNCDFSFQKKNLLSCLSMQVAKVAKESNWEQQNSFWTKGVATYALSPKWHDNSET